MYITLEHARATKKHVRAFIITDVFNNVKTQKLSALFFFSYKIKSLRRRLYLYEAMDYTFFDIRMYTMAQQL